MNAGASWRECCPSCTRTAMEGAVMSQRMVGIVVNRLLTEQDLRVRFALDRIETLAELSFRGFELTSDEIDVLIRTDPRLWFWDSEAAVERVH
jgi:hypothetical protein